MNASNFVLTFVLPLPTNTCIIQQQKYCDISCTNAKWEDNIESIHFRLQVGKVITGERIVVEMQCLINMPKVSSLPESSCSFRWFCFYWWGPMLLKIAVIDKACLFLVSLLRSKMWHVPVAGTTETGACHQTVSPSGDSSLGRSSISSHLLPVAMTTVLKRKHSSYISIFNIGFYHNYLYLI